MAKLIRQNLEAKLAALGGAEWDSMSEDSDHSDVETHDALAPPPLPLRAQKNGKKKGKGATGSVVPVGPAGQPSGVVYIGHIPHGFYEEAMNGFFKQFGDVVRVRVSRSKLSGRCKGYAYVEFSSPEVAGIVAETMNGYFLFDKQLVCRVLRFDEIHPNLFDGAGVKFRKVDWHALYRKKYNVDRTPSKDKRHARTLVGKDKVKRSKLAALGIDYEFPGFEASLKDRQPAQGTFEGATAPEEKPSKKRKAVDESTEPSTPAITLDEAAPPSSKRGGKAKKATPVKVGGKTGASAKPASAKKTPAKVARTATPAKAANAKKTPAKVKETVTPTKAANTKKTPTKGGDKTATPAKPSSAKKTPAKAASTVTPAKAAKAKTTPAKSKDKSPAAAASTPRTPKASGKKQATKATPPASDAVGVGSARGGKGKRKSPESPVATADDQPATRKKTPKKRSASEGEEEPVSPQPGGGGGGVRKTPKRAKRAKA